MKTFFTILTTITVLIGATLFYVVKDTSKVVFEPEKLSESTPELEGHGTQTFPRDSLEETTQSKNDQNFDEVYDPVNQTPATDLINTEANFSGLSQQPTDSLSTQSVEEEENEKRIQNEIRELRDDTNRILNNIINN